MKDINSGLELSAISSRTQDLQERTLMLSYMVLVHSNFKMLGDKA